MLKILIKSAMALVTVLLVAVMLWVSTLPSLPEKSEQIINNVLNSPVPEFITGKTGYVKSGEINIWYELKTPVLETAQKPKGTILLINGMGASALFWPSLVFDVFLNQGYQVIATDNRGLGNSDWIDNWNRANAYSLSDMVDDNLAVLDALAIEKAHVLGLSLGGMIAQEMAIAHPERVSSLTSVMSSGFGNDPQLPVPKHFQHNAIKLMLRYGLLESEENLIRLTVGTYQLLKGESEIDVERLSRATLYEIRRRKGFNRRVFFQQATAMTLSGSRYDALSQLTTPTLVIHGEDDPLLDIAHAKKYAKLIPNAQTLWVSGMGHAGEPEYLAVWLDNTVQFINAHNLI